MSGDIKNDSIDANTSSLSSSNLIMRDTMGNLDAPNNGIYIVLGEINLLLANLKRNTNASGNSSSSSSGGGGGINSKYYHDHYYHNDPLSRNFYELKALLNEHCDLNEIDSTTFMTPFLEVIKSEETSGPVTGMALTSVSKFISYGLVGINNETSAHCVQQIADSITHARFVGTDSSSDEVVLMKILHVLRTLMLSPIGFYLTNSSVCEIMQSCFQICFENRLTELLRRSAESMLVDMVQLLFARLPQFNKEEIKFNSIATSVSSSTTSSSVVKKLTMTTSSKAKLKHNLKQKSKTKTTASLAKDDENLKNISESANVETSESFSKAIEEPKTEYKENDVNIDPSANNANESEEKTDEEDCENDHDEIEGEEEEQEKVEHEEKSELNQDEKKSTTKAKKSNKDYVNPRGVRFIQETSASLSSAPGSATSTTTTNAANTPYGLPCVRELLRFLISLINTKNSDLMISMGLNLITIGLESGIDYISSYQSLLAYVKDDLLKNLYQLLSTERMAQYASVLRVSFLLFESLRLHLKLQMEHFLNKLMDICLITSPNDSYFVVNNLNGDLGLGSSSSSVTLQQASTSANNNKSNANNSNKQITQEQKEMTIDYFLQMLRIPGFAVEIYLNYDCSLNCSNLFENLTKLLSKNAYSVQSLLTANSLSLSALLTIIDNIELENTLKNSISIDRLNFLKNYSLANVRAPPSSGFTAASSLGNAATAASITASVSSSSSLNNLKSRPRMAQSNFETNSINKKVTTNRMKIQHEKLPKPEELKLIRTKKRLINQSIDLFNNTSPAKSIQFLKDNNLLVPSNLSNTNEALFTKYLVKYLRETPQLDKRVLGEYLSNRKNNLLLDEFIKSFNFAGLRIDEALRLFLETFRLPGEAPLISTIMEYFARHWRSSNPTNKIANDDAAFTLAYAIIMLNVDQHNHNVKKQSTPMVVEQFKKNLSKVNDGGNFEDSLLEEIFVAIKTDEIIMPAEHTGVLRDNYMWKLLIRRQCTSPDDAMYIHAPSGSYNQEIFNIVWGQTISALSFVYDKSLELNVIKKSINGFRKCAQIAAHFMMNDVFDNIVIALCKFTTLQKTGQLTSSASMSLLNVNSSSVHNTIDRDGVSSSLAGSGISGSSSGGGSLSDPAIEQLNEQISINFGMNNKAQLACKTVFQLIHSHGDILRDGWKNILDCILQLYKCKLLPKVLVECEDYLDRTGRILLIKDKPDTIDSVSIDANVASNQSSGGGLFSFFPFMSSSSDANMQKGPSQEDLEAIKNAKTCIDECHIEQLIHDTKFLRVDSLLEFIKALIFNQTGSLVNGPSDYLSEINEDRFPSLATTHAPFRLIDNDCSVFNLETLIKVVLQNRDRITCIWPIIRNHFYNIIMSTNFVVQHKMSCTLSQTTTKQVANQKTSKNASRNPTKPIIRPMFPFDTASLFFIERTIVGLLRITARLLRREELANEVLTCLRMLLLFRRKTLVRKLARQVTYGIHDLLRTNAANIHTSQDWSNIFSILKVYGAGANPPTLPNNSSQFGYRNKAAQNEKTEPQVVLTPTNDQEKISMVSLSSNVISSSTDRGYTSDSELHNQHQHSNQLLPDVSSQTISSAVSDQSLNTSNSLIVSSSSSTSKQIDTLSTSTTIINANTQMLTNSANQYKIDLDDEGLGQHDKRAFAKCCEILTFLIRDMAHVSITNFESCIHCLRTFVEACVLHGGLRTNKILLTQETNSKNSKPNLKATSKSKPTLLNDTKKTNLQKSKSISSNSSQLRSNSPMSLEDYGSSSAAQYFNEVSSLSLSLDQTCDLDHNQIQILEVIDFDFDDNLDLDDEQDQEDEDDQLITSYETMSIQLLDLLDTLHIKAAYVFTQWSEEQKQRYSTQDLSENENAQVSNLWSKCWCPILQGIARLSCDINGEVRMHALQYLQRALLVHELQKLSAIEWESCFNKVLFPLLAKLLENIDPRNSMRMEETRMRASTLLCKVFLQHLTTLARLSTFTALWLTILDYMDKYIKSDKSDNLLHDVIPESLKNMLLVMETTGLFNSHYSQLSIITKDRIESFLPGLWEETFKINNKNEIKQQQPQILEETLTNVNDSIVNEEKIVQQANEHQLSENTNDQNNEILKANSKTEIKDI